MIYRLFVLLRERAKEAYVTDIVVDAINCPVVSYTWFGEKIGVVAWLGQQRVSNQ